MSDTLDTMLAAIKPHLAATDTGRVLKTVEIDGSASFEVWIFGDVPCEHEFRLRARVSDERYPERAVARALGQLASGQCQCTRCIEDRATEALGQEGAGP